MRKVKAQEFYDFVAYCHSFYGEGELDDMGVSRAALRAACRLVTYRKDIPFDGDTMDREKVRDILESLGYGDQPGHRLRLAAFQQINRGEAS